MKPHATSHTSFVIERDFTASPQRVFAAWSDPDAKRRWSDCHADCSDNDYSLDFRPGGRETHRVVFPDGSVQMIRKLFFDIVPDVRIIFGYDIQLDQRRLSVSLVTLQLEPRRGGTHLTLTEYIAYLDGHQDLEGRIRGTNEGLDRLGLALQNELPMQ